MEDVHVTKVGMGVRWFLFAHGAIFPKPVFSCMFLITGFLILYTKVGV